MNPALCVPKLTGADIELGNFVEGAVDHDASVVDASQALLGEIRRAVGAAPLVVSEVDSKGQDAQDRERTFLATNGGCAYIDLDHLELCIPEVRSAFDHVAYWHAMLRVASDAQVAVNARRPPTQRVQLLANNSDGRVSYGSHLNVLVSRTAWDEVVHRKPHYLAWLTAFQVSSLPITGQGKVGSEHGADPVAYQLSQRADYFETITGLQTTFRRPLVNTRDEPLCGGSRTPRGAIARLHCIFFDTTLCHVATLLRVGMMQLVLAMIEAGDVDSRLALEDPLDAVARWSHDPTLRASASLVGGERLTALQLQQRFLDAAQQFVHAGGAEGIVPRAREVLALWSDTLVLLEARNFAALAGRLDWVLKLSFLERAFQYRPELRWNSPEIKHLDHLYSSLDRGVGLHWSMANQGLVDTVVSDAEIRRCVREPPADTRAWDRAMLLRCAGAAVEQVDWDFVRIRLEHDATTWRVDLPDPLGVHEGAQRAATRDSGSLGELLSALGATREPPHAYAAHAIAPAQVTSALKGLIQGGPLSSGVARMPNYTTTYNGGKDGSA